MKLSRDRAEALILLLESSGFSDLAAQVLSQYRINLGLLVELQHCHHHFEKDSDYCSHCGVHRRFAKLDYEKVAKDYQENAVVFTDFGASDIQSFIHKQYQRQYGSREGAQN